MSKSRARDLADIADKNMSGTMSVDALDISGNIAVVGTVDGRNIATDGTKLDGVEASATADQTKADIEGLGIDLPAANLTGTIDAARLSTAATQLESDDSTKIATTAYVVDKITTLIGGAPSTLNDLNELAAAINDDASYNSTLTTALGTKLPKAGGTMTGDLTVPNVIVSGNVDGRDVSVDGTKLDGIEAGATNYTHPTNHAISVITGLQAALDGKVDDAQVLTNVPANAVFTDTNTTYSVGDGGLSQINFTSADHTKLNGIEAGATADQTAAQILTAIKTVDGTGSGLDADTLDGTQLSGIVQRNFQDASRNLNIFTNSTSAAGLFMGASDGAFRFQVYGETGLYGFLASDWGNWDLKKAVDGQLQLRVGGTDYTVWHNGNDGAGSGLDADTLDGVSSASFLRSDASDTFTTLTGQQIIMNGSNSRSKYMVWNADNQYGIGMGSSYTYGGIANEYVMSFQMSNDNGRGYWWGDIGHTNAQGAMALTTQGKLTVAHSIRAGYGESDTTAPGASYKLDIDGPAYFSGEVYSLNARLGSDANNVWLRHRTTNESIIYGQLNSKTYIYYNGVYRINTEDNGMSVNSDGTATSVRMHTNNGVLRGYVYANNSNEIGFLDAGGSWAYKIQNDASHIWYSNSSTTRMTLTNSGNLTVTGEVTANSDERIKDNIAVIPDALEKVKAIRGITYTRTDIEDKETVHVGVIAQEVEAVLPEAVREGDEGIKSVAYGNMVGLLIEAIKEQQVQIDELKKRIK
tara:strand:+ start:77 stop:2332 length:2256 start_codon:yes stop_codon:yes gene_type:complete